MKRSVLLAIAALAILVLPATALADDTRIDRAHEHYGLLVPTGPSTWTVQDLDYARVATVQRTNAKRFDFLRDGKPVGSVRQLSGRVWKVYKGDTKVIGEVRKTGRRTASVYAAAGADAIGLGEGKDAVPAAASVLFRFAGATGLAKHDHSTHRH
jgi:hypothetical protein